MKKLEQLSTKLTLIIIGLTAGSGLLVPATYASFHPVTTGEIADNTIRSADISNTYGVRSVDIVNGQVGSLDIGDGQVSYQDIGGGHVFSEHIRDSTITSADLGSSAVQIVQGSGVNIAAGNPGTAVAHCPSGEIVTGGGFFANNYGMRVVESYPQDSDTWRVHGYLESQSSGTLWAWALCV